MDMLIKAVMLWAVWTFLDILFKLFISKGEGYWSTVIDKSISYALILALFIWSISF